jgi:hypothetical protein
MNLETKNAICRRFGCARPNVDCATAAFMQFSFPICNQYAAKFLGMKYVRFLLDAEIDPKMSMFCAIQTKKIFPSVNYWYVYIEPIHFCNMVTMKMVTASMKPPPPPFHASSRQSDTSIFEYFLGIWNERFASTRGKNGDGDYPIHVVCCDPYVSFQAIKV